MNDDENSVAVEEEVNKLTFGDLNDGVLHLPGGFVDEDGNLHKEVHIREMTGEEEDILLSSKVPGHQKIERVLINCVDKVGDISGRKDIEGAVHKMVVGDRVVLLLALRIMSVGEEYSFGSVCGACDAKNTHLINLMDLDVKRPSDPKCLKHSVTLPSGKVATLKVMTGEDEARVANYRRSKVGKKKSDQDVMTLNILARLTELDGNVANTKSAKQLSFRDRKAIREWYVKNEGGVDTKLELVCDSCGFEYESVLDAGQPDFFFPRDSD